MRNGPMAIYHFSIKPVKRSCGRSSVSAAAYRSGERLYDERTGVLHDYSRKSGVVHTGIVWNEGELSISRERLWNLAEHAELRKDACVAREIVVALPAEISPLARSNLVQAYSSFLARTRNCVIDFAIHSPSRYGDQRNFHAHILCSTREFNGAEFGKKILSEQAGQNRKKDLISLRISWERAVNWILEKNNISERVDCRSYIDQGRNFCVPTIHLGAAATAIERKTSQSSKKRTDWIEAAREIIPELVNKYKNKRDLDLSPKREKYQNLDRGRQYER